MLNIFFKIDNTPVTLDPDPDQNWAKILDPDTNSMCLDPQHSLNTAFLIKKKKIHNPLVESVKLLLVESVKLSRIQTGRLGPFYPPYCVILGVAW